MQNQNVEPQVSVTLIASAPNTTAGTLTLGIVDDDTPSIQFTLDRNTVSENAGANAVIGTLTLDRALANATSASFAVSAAGQISPPASVSVPANTQSVLVPITIMDNSVIDGNRTVTITAHLRATSGGTVATAPPVELAITDDEGPSLTLAFDRDLFLEGRDPAGSGVVAETARPAPALTVTLTSANPAKLIVPATVTIPAGQPSATFPIRTVDDGQPNGNQTIVGHQPPPPATTRTVPISCLRISRSPTSEWRSSSPPAGAETDVWTDVRLMMTNQGASDAAGPFTQRVLLSSDATDRERLARRPGRFRGPPSGRALPSSKVSGSSFRAKRGVTGSSFRPTLITP